MKNRKNLLAVLGIGVLLFIVYMVPTLVTAVEDRHLQSESRKYEIREIRLNLGKADLTEKLSAMQKLLEENVVVQKGAVEEHRDSIENMVREYLSLLNENRRYEFSLFSVVEFVIADTDADKVYTLWKCCALDENEDEYIFWIDEKTEKVLAFDIPFYFMEDESEEFYRAMERVKEYYNFTYVKLPDKAGAFLKQVNSQMRIQFLNELEGAEVSLMMYKNKERLYFNMYSKTIRVFDVE